MTHEFDIVTFDCYGTLIDWESGIAEAFAAEGASESRENLLRMYAATEAEVERERYRPYRDVLAETATRVARSLGWTSNGAFLAESLARWKPFDDTNAALEKLRASGLALGILSNVDDDLLTATRRHFTVDFELVVTAQQVGSYKPSHGHFVTAKHHIGARRWLHAAQSNFHDIVPANHLGIPTAWVNRRSETPSPGGIPTFEVRDLTELAEVI